MVLEGRIEATNFKGYFLSLVSTPHCTARIKLNKIVSTSSAVQVYGGTNTAYSTNGMFLKQNVRWRKISKG
jgi:hypothetical protein